VLELAYPWALALLPLPWLVRKFVPPYREQVAALRIPFFAEIVEAAGLEAKSGSVILRRKKLQMLAAVLVWTLLVVAIAKPQWVGEPIVRTEASRDVMLAIDLSGSMDYRDFPDVDGEKVERLDGVKQVVDQFVAERESDRVGLIVFGDRAFLQLPFTRDLKTARDLVNLMSVGMAGPRTAIGDAIGLSIKSFEESEVEERLLILLTDGNDTASKMKPINAAGIAKQSGVEVYTIGVGDPEATGEDRVDFGLLQRVAETTGGQFFSAEDHDTLDEVYRRIDELAVADVKTTSWRPRESMVHWPAGAAVALMLLSYGTLLIASRTGRGRHA
jgi:Ca-activated chloride channel family protein